MQTCTSAGWDGVLAGLMNDKEPGCNATSTDEMPNGNCGNAGLAIVYLVTYLVMTFLVVINMYIAVILENFSQVGPLRHSTSPLQTFGTPGVHHETGGTSIPTFETSGPTVFSSPTFWTLLSPCVRLN